MHVTRLFYLYPGEVEIVWSHQGFPPPRVSSSRCKKSSQSLSKSAVVDLWGQVLPTDDLPGVLPVAQHDRLVHDHPLRRLRLVTPRDSYDVEVRAGERGKSVLMESDHEMKFSPRQTCHSPTHPIVLAQTCTLSLCTNHETDAANAKNHGINLTQLQKRGTQLFTMVELFCLAPRSHLKVSKKITTLSHSLPHCELFTIPSDFAKRWRRKSIYSMFTFCRGRLELFSLMECPPWYN